MDHTAVTGNYLLDVDPLLLAETAVKGIDEELTATESSIRNYKSRLKEATTYQKQLYAKRDELAVQIVALGGEE